jgi:hypothetical protein
MARITEQTLQHLSFDSPDEVREGADWRMEILNLAGGATVGRMTLQPGWRWTTSIGEAVAGTTLCEAPHQQYLISGMIHVQMADGTEFTTTAGEVTSIPAGHDAWVVGDEPVIGVDWQGASVWAHKG